MEFDDYEEKQYKIWDYLNIGLYRYKVLDIRKCRVVCERMWLVNN